MKEARVRLVLIVVGAALMLALAEALAEFISPGWRPPYSFLEIFVRLLPPWLIAALLVPFVLAAVRRFPLIPHDRSVWPRVALHTVFGALFAVVHFVLLAAYHELWGDPSGTFLFNVLAFLDDYVVTDLAVYWAMVGAISSVAYFRSMREREVAAAELRASLSEARLQSLHAQLQPHFLFNALNTIAMQVRQGMTTEAVSMLSEFSELLRELLEDAPASETTLRAELDFTRRYLGIEQIRFGDRLRVDYQIDPETQRGLVPALILQPLVENAIKHGIARRAGAGVVRVCARRERDAEGERLCIDVSDNGPGLPEDFSLDRFSGVGLRNTRARLAQLDPRRSSFELVIAGREGVTASITLPWRTGP